jgi:hypothetical protein
MSLAKENQELRARLAILEKRVEELTPKPVAPEPKQNHVLARSQTFWEVWSIINGRRGAYRKL